MTALEHLPERTETEPGQRRRTAAREGGRSRTGSRKLTERAPAVAEFIGRNVQEFNGTPDDPHSFDRLDKLLDAQVYRLSHWKAAADEINYRRFFDINDLAAVCMEDPEVFAESHRLVFELLVRGDVDGLRIDHIDGLYDPMEYLRRLQGGYLRALGKALLPAGRGRPRPPARRAAGRRAGRTPPPPWNDVEPAFLPQVTAHDLHRPRRAAAVRGGGKDPRRRRDPARRWLVAGTTGYDFLNSVGGLFVDPAGLAELTKIYGRFIDQRLDFREVAYQSKLLILRTAMSSDLQLLAHRLNRISERHRRSRDFTLNTLRIALREILACFPVYRTYIREGYVSERDRQVVCRAAAQAKRRNPATNAAVFDFIRDVLLLEAPAGAGRSRPPRAGAVRRPLPAGHQPGDGQGDRGHGLLPLLSAGVAERSGRRPGPRRRRRRGVPSPEPGAAGRSGRGRCWPPPRTTPSAAKTSARGSTCFRRSRTCGARP